MPESTVVRTKKDLVIVIQDQGAAQTYTLDKIPGDFAYDAPLYDLVDILDNGDLGGVRKGDEQPVTVSFSAHLRDVGSGAHITLPDICEERGYWASNMTSTTAQTSDVPTEDLVVTVDGTAFGESDKSMTFEDMVLRGSASFQYPAQYSVTGRSTTKTKPTVA